VLAFIWENTFVTGEMRLHRGIHATPPNIARYIVNRLPLESILAKKGGIVEPCCGSGTFMIAALQRLRELLTDTPPPERHSFFVKMLKGFDTEERGLDIARSSLTLADFPNPNGWKLTNEDVFDSPAECPKFIAALKQADIVLCNPPFEDFSESEQERYDFSFVQKPAEILSRVLEFLPVNGMLGLVLPHEALVPKKLFAISSCRETIRQGLPYSIGICHLPFCGWVMRRLRRLSLIPVNCSCSRNAR
jgi:type I restriction-modification system DNA methylase subunit